MFLAISKNFTHLCEFNFCQICMVRVYWNSMRIFWEKIVQYSNLFGLWPKFFGTFRGKISEALSKRNCTPPVQPFRETFLTIYKCIKFFDLAKKIGFWEEGIQQDAKTKFDVIRETFWGKIFKKVLKISKFFVPWAKKSSPFGRNCLTMLSKLISTCPEEQFEDFFPENIPKFQKFFGLWAESFETFGGRFSPKSMNLEKIFVSDRKKTLRFYWKDTKVH